MVEYDDLTPEQRDAVDALDRSVTLTAGAGSGKTTTLTARYLAMIEDSLREGMNGGTATDHLLPENILTTTFTERAANDLESSVRTEITERIASLDRAEFDAWRTVADELEHGYIHTLHGFCSRLLREHALTIDDIDPGFDTLDEDESAALIHDTVGAVLEDYDSHEATRTLARRFSRAQLHDVLADLVEARPESVAWAEEWADASEEEYLEFVETHLHPIDPEEAAERLADPAFVEAATTLTELVEDPPDIDTGGSTWRRASEVVDTLPTNFDDGIPSREKQTLLSQLSLLLTTGSNERYAGYTGANSRWNDHPQKEAFDRAFEQLVEVLEPEEFAVNIDLEIEANSVPFVRSLAELTLITAEEYESRKAQQNALDFTDLITRAVSFLSDETNDRVREQLREQFEYVMVDEFQDTDPRQWDLIKLLTTGDGETFDAENVFVVGDVKQSIYRFRNADVTQFREIAQTIEQRTRDKDAGAEDQLTTNFRTLPTTLHCINELFDTIFVEDGEPFEAPPQPLIPHREDPVDLGSFEYLAVPTDPELRARRFDHFEAFAETEPDHDTQLEAMALAARLSQVLAETYQVYPEESEDVEDGSGDSPPEPRDIKPDDIAILIRSRTHLKKYERALEEADVPYSVASGLGFFDTTEVTTLLNLFRALADPSDERALYAALRSPLFGLTDDTLARLKREGEPLWEALATTDHEQLAEAHTYLAKWRQLAGSTDENTGLFDGSWADFLTRILEDTGYIVSVSADERPQQAMANVEKFREHLRTWSEDGVRSLATLVKRIERRMDLGGRESEADTTGEGVQILTIHDAKGMEFPFVVVPGIDRGFNDGAALGSGQVEFEQIGDQHAIGMKAPSSEDPFEMEDTIARQTIRERRRAEERAEEKRCLYVACTRARDHLLLSGLHESGDDAEEPTLTDLEAPEPDDASGWRDWVQPELLTEDVCEALVADNQVSGPYGDGNCTVSLPTPPIERVPPEVEDTPDLVLSPSPASPELSFRLTATQLAALLGGYADLGLDDDSNIVHAEEIDDETAERPDRRHGDESLAAPEDVTEYPRSTSGSDEGEIDPAVFGEAVHRICELRPPEDRWPDLMEQTFVDAGTEVELTTELTDRVRTHARRGLEYVRAREADADVEQGCDELYVTAEFNQGEISGFIDHLIVTPEAYHIIDYKTGDVATAELEEDANYYVNQMKAYAVALNQQGTGRDVRVSLVFTALDQAWQVEWDTSTLSSMEGELTTELRQRLKQVTARTNDRGL